jgi:eukaryotic-like serine/threonine-protein kinase
MAVNGVAWSSDGKYLATAGQDKKVKVWKSPPAGTLINTYSNHTGEVEAVAWYSDNICSVSCDTTIQVWNAFTLEGIFHSNFPSPRNCVHSVSWSPDGKSVVASSWNGKVEVWKPPLITPIFTYGGHTKAVSAVAWSPNGNYVASGSDDHTVQVWKVL